MKYTNTRIERDGDGLALVVRLPERFAGQVAELAERHGMTQDDVLRQIAGGEDCHGASMVIDLAYGFPAVPTQTV